MHKKLLEKIHYIFYVPGSAGSLLSVLIKSQLEKNFIFDGFVDDTAHNYKIDAIKNTHDYNDYINFKEAGIDLDDHLEKNLHRDSLVQRIVFPKWIDEFVKKKYANLSICYMENYNLKLLNFYKKLHGSPLAKPIDEEFNFQIDKNHKHYETIIYIKVLNWHMTLEQKHVHTIPIIKIDNVLKKDFSDLDKICKITNVSIMSEIVDEYNKKNKNNFNILPNGMKRYLKKYHNSI